MDHVALEEIRRVKYRYLRCVDEKLWDEIVDVFTQDATADYGTPSAGRPTTARRRPAGRCSWAAGTRSSRSCGTAWGRTSSPCTPLASPRLTSTGRRRPASGGSRTP